MALLRPCILGLLLASACAAHGSRTQPGTDGGRATPYDAGQRDASDAGRDAGHDSFDAASPAPAGRLFRVWAPHADAAELVGTFDDDVARAMERTGDGHFEVRVEHVQAGDLYHFVIHTGGEAYERVDPRALAWDEATQRSRVVGLAAASAEERAFAPPTTSHTVIYELHAASFFAPSDDAAPFAHVQSKLAHLAELGVNTVELMPVHEFPGAQSWGYNPRLPFAVEASYGGPEALRELVRDAHAQGIAVLLDVVYNHLEKSSPLCRYDGFSLLQSCGGIYFYGDSRALTDWGPRFDYGRAEVRSYLAEGVDTWLSAFRFDGLRFDSTCNIWNTNNGTGADIPDGARLLRELNDLIDARAPGALSIAEDLHAGERVTRPTAESGFGFDAQWDPGFHDALVPVLTRAADTPADLSAITRALTASRGLRAFSRVIFLESHDSTGKLNGHRRLTVDIDPDEPQSARVQRRSLLGALLLFTAPGIPMMLQGQEMLADGAFHDDAPLDWSYAQSQAPVLEKYRELVRLRRNVQGHSAGLTGGDLTVTHMNQRAGVLAYRRSGAGLADVMVLVNTSSRAFTAYRIGVPHGGTWRVRVSTVLYAPATLPALSAEPQAYDGLPYSVVVPLSVESGLVLSQD